MKLAFLVDPLPKLKVTKDSSIAMMRAAQARGHEIWTCQREGLCWEEGTVWLSAQLIALTDGGAGAWYEVVSEARVRADQFDALLMRQDPPFDFEYLTATWLLERAEAQGPASGTGRGRSETIRRNSPSWNSRSLRPPRWWRATPSASTPSSTLWAT